MDEKIKSFTLIELLIVIIIIGILAGVAISQYEKMREKVHAVEAINILGAIRKSEVAYKAAHGYYIDVFFGCSYNGGGAPDLGTGCNGGGTPGPGYIPHTVCINELGLSDSNVSSQYWYYDGMGNENRVRAFRRYPNGTWDDAKYISMDYETGEITATVPY